MSIPRLIPVLDLKEGRVVRAVGGRRDEYRPVESKLTTSREPAVIAQALIDAAAAAELYIADLDAIEGAPPAWSILALLRSLRTDLWVDAGVRATADALALAEFGIDGVVCGLESVAGPAVLAEIVERLGPRRTIFSLDLRSGVPLADLNHWNVADVSALLERILALGVRRLIVLDLTHIGAGQGLHIGTFCRGLAARFAHLEIFTGGGLRDNAEWSEWSGSGIAGLLSASALHDGKLAAVCRP